MHSISKGKSRRWQSTLRLVALGLAIAIAVSRVWGGETARAGTGPATDDSLGRHARVAARRAGPHVICHRGAWEFAHENTLEAFRATFELGGDGNEIDIRATKDGVLVCFHDDMLDRLLEAYGDVSDYTWDELRRFRFRHPGRFGDQCRIPTLAEVFELHRRHAGLLHLDIKVPGIDRQIADLLDRMDLWDHVAHCNAANADAIVRHPRLKLCRYKGELYIDRGDVFPKAIGAMLARPGEGVILEDPRGVAVALGRKFGPLARDPVAPPSAPLRSKTWSSRPAAELVAVLNDADDWHRVAESPADRGASGKRILDRALAAEQLRTGRVPSSEARAALVRRVRERSLHKDWRYHGLDAAAALRTLIGLQAPEAVEAARFALWRDDPLLETVADPNYKNPRAWTDFRVKMVVFPALTQSPSQGTDQLCRDYLALSDREASALGPPLFEEAARTLLAAAPSQETALELLRHRLQVVRGRAILECLARADQPWARAALQTAAPHALAYLVK